jgi:hypothetical protein
VKIWLYKGNALWALVIEAWTGKYAHIELEIKPGLFFSSTIETGPRICSFEQLVSQNMDDWDVVDLGTIEADNEIVWKAAQMMLNADQIYGVKLSYNKEGIAKNFLPVPLVDQNPTQDFCSQSVATVTSAIQLFMNMVMAEMSPSNCGEWLAKYLSKWQALRFKINEGA